MMLVIEGLLTAEEVRHVMDALRSAPWRDGRLTAGVDAARVKSNLQADPDDAVVKALAERMQARVQMHPEVMSGALPARMSVPRFCRYRPDDHYGLHVDAALFPDPEGRLLRSDVSATLFLSAPETYSGGELTIETGFGAQSVKLPAGSLVLYPSSSLHEVAPVVEGERLVAILWAQSMVRSAEQRALLYDLDRSLQALRSSNTRTEEALTLLTGVYHNLLRQWSES